MRSVIVSWLFTLRASLRDRAALQLEILALRHQLQVLERTRPRRVRLTRCRPATLGLAVRRVARMADGGRHREARDRARLASAGLPPALDLEESAPSGPTRGACGRPRVDSHDVGHESAVGRAEDSRRALEAGHRRLRSDRREVHGASPAPAVPDVADVPRQSHRPDRGRRFLRRAHHHVSTAVRAGHSGPPAPARRSRRRHRASDRGVDRPTTPRGVSRRRRLRAISFTIATTRLPRSRPRRAAWASRNSAPPLVPHGRTRMRSGSSAPSDASASIT